MSRLELRGVSREYQSGDTVVHALRDVDLTIESGEFVAVVGPSGGGKSTLLSILGGLEVPSAGLLLVDGEPAPLREGPALAALRARTFGFVFQGFHLLEQRAAIDSVALGMLYQGVPNVERRRRAHDAAERVGLGDRLGQRTVTLSGGQRQRIAIARAIAADSPVLLADEPTGNLDSATGEQVMDQLRELHRKGVTVVVVTHSDRVASAAGRVVRIVDGRLTETNADSVRGEDVGRIECDLGEQRGLLSRVADLVGDAVASLRSRTRQSAALAATVGLAVALLVTTLGLMDSTRTQVTATFDAHANREVSVGWSLGQDAAPAVSDLSAATALAGVDAAAVLTAYSDVPVGNLRGDVRVVKAREAAGALGSAADARISWAHESDERVTVRLGAGDALIGEALARQLLLGPLVAGPMITVAGQPYTVRGILESSGRMPGLTGEVIVGAAPAALPPSDRSLLVVARSGAARQIGDQLPLALDARHPDRFHVSVPSDPRRLRGEVESGVQIALLAVTAVSTLIALLTLMNSIGSAILARRPELGLRRALGARSGDLIGLVVTESTLVGAAGGFVGLVAGLTAILGFTIAQRWVPVFDLRLAPLAIGCGIAVGALASMIGAIRAARVRPADALRQ
jgi:macrolide transport system ATP-binding/permease protein